MRVALDKAQIEARPVWKPMHKQPVYCRTNEKGIVNSEKLPGATLTSSNSVATRDSQSELCSPLAAPSLSRDDREGFRSWNENFLYFPCGINFYSYLCTQKSTESHFTDVFGHHSS